MIHDSDYYLARAEAELVLARSASHPAAMRAHYHLAGHYLDKAHSAPAGTVNRTTPEMSPAPMMIQASA